LFNISRPPQHFLVRHRSRADDAARTHIARLAQVRDQLGEIKHYVDTCLRLPDQLAVPGRAQRQVHLAALPRITELVGHNRHRRKTHCRLRLQKAGPLRQLGRYQVAQRNVVHRHQQLDLLVGVVRARAHRHVAARGCIWMNGGSKQLKASRRADPSAPLPITVLRTHHRAWAH
jgi:hypothetical protein